LATTIEIVQGLAQAAANAYDGSHDERFTADGTSKKVGLRREEGDPLVDKRIMDGFGVKFSGSKLIVSYQGEMTRKDINNGKYTDVVEDCFKQIASFLKKEYKSVVGSSVSLSEDGPATVHVQALSRIRTFVMAQKVYNIGSIKEVENIGQGTPDDLLDASIKKFLEIGKDKYTGAKKPENVTRKEA
jgi:hypothetical protein|tara:strand:+ start:3836 stop:4396 length:561 start_codon:yes stop_codon:yes gene_type:complete